MTGADGIGADDCEHALLPCSKLSAAGSVLAGEAVIFKHNCKNGKAGTWAVPAFAAMRMSGVWCVGAGKISDARPLALTWGVSENSQCDRQRGIFALRKTFFCRNTDVFQEKMTRRGVKRPAVRVRWRLSDTPWGGGGVFFTVRRLDAGIQIVFSQIIFVNRKEFRK